jgi:antitoxin CptB
MSEGVAKGPARNARQRRILFRSWHRGMREVDLILGRFAGAKIAKLCESELDDYESLLEAADRDIFCWMTGESTPPAAYDTPIFRRLLAFHCKAGSLEDPPA